MQTKLDKAAQNIEYVEKNVVGAGVDELVLNVISNPLPTHISSGTFGYLIITAQGKIGQQQPEP